MNRIIFNLNDNSPNALFGMTYSIASLFLNDPTVCLICTSERQYAFLRSQKIGSEKLVFDPMADIGPDVLVSIRFKALEDLTTEEEIASFIQRYAPVTM